jgi:hypothetical protein
MSGIDLELVIAWAMASGAEHAFSLEFATVEAEEPGSAPERGSTFLRVSSSHFSMWNTGRGGPGAPKNLGWGFRDGPCPASTTARGSGSRGRKAPQR